MMFSMIFVMITMSAASGRRILEVIDEQTEITSPTENAVTVVKNGDIDFQDVSFAYNEGTGDYAIRDITLHINSGETIGVIGGTGCGKSTLAALVSRLYDASKGVVMVGGVDVRQYDLTTLRNSVSMVLQKNVLFSGSVLDNLRWSKEDATLEECREACRLAQADDFIMEMPEGYDTRIEQNGNNVSGGQKQRLCIARALLKSPRFLFSTTLQAPATQPPTHAYERHSATKCQTPRNSSSPSA